MSIKVIIADDHPLVRSGIRGELSRHPRIDVVAEATNGDETWELTKKHHPEVLLLDINMPGMKAFHIIRALKAEDTPPKILILTAYGDTTTILGMLKAGADGYLLKEEHPSLIPKAIQSLLDGENWLSQAVSEKVQATFSGKKKLLSGNELTSREREVLQLMARGDTNKKIAISLQTSVRTVEFHVSNILEKLGVEGRVEAVVWAKERGWI
jgi:DNA-binding NarL/FixJ family response regulator